MALGRATSSAAGRACARRCADCATTPSSRRGWPRRRAARRERSSSSAGRTTRATRRPGSGSVSPTRPADVIDPAETARTPTATTGTDARRSGSTARRPSGSSPAGAGTGRRTSGSPSGRARSGCCCRSSRRRRLDVLTVPLGEPRGGLPRGARVDRARPDEQHQLVRRRREPAHPDQEPGDAPAAARRTPAVARTTRARPGGGAPGAAAPVPGVPRRRRGAARRRQRSSRAVPPRAVRRARVRPRRRDDGAIRRRRSTRALLVRALDGLVQVLPEPEPPPEVIPRTITLTQRASIIRLALRGAPSIVLQDLLRGVHDRVVVAVTFLAMLELMKRREVVVEQAEPFGPITARCDDRRGAMPPRASPPDVEHAPLDESLDSYA